MKTKILAVALFALFLFSASAANAALTETQTQAILELLNSFGADTDVVTNVENSLREQTIVVAAPTSSEPAEPSLFNQNLGYGSTGPEVVKLQQFLKDRGYFLGDTTGNFFSQTKEAVKVFQRAYAISDTGYFGFISRQVANGILLGNKTVVPINQVTTPAQTPTTQLSSKADWVWVFTNRGVPLPDEAVSFLCDSVKPAVLKWLTREATKYTKLIPFNDIVCLDGQTTLPGSLLNLSERSVLSTGVVASPLNDDAVIKYLEDALPAVKAAKYVMIIHYIPADLSFNHHAFPPKYDFMFFKKTRPRGSTILSSFESK